MVNYIQHKNILFCQLVGIAQIKKLSWVYPIESQIDWIEKNVKPWDYHLLIDNAAYCHLTPIILYVDNELKIGYGIGSVCTIEPGKGYGEMLMNEVNSFLTHIQKPGLLFCHARVIPFYGKYEWKLVEKSKLMILINDDAFNTMIYGVKKYEMIKYEGRIF